MAAKKPFKNALFVVKRLYVENELGDRNLLLLKSDQQARIKLSKIGKSSLEQIHSHLHN